MKNNRTFLEKLLDGAEVEWKPLNKIVTTITAPVKLKREMYCSTGSTPIIDQGEKFIAGYTDENFEAIPSNEYIIFGDHSEHIKYVNFSFIQGADGLKILKPKEDNAKYIYYSFQNFYVKELNYKRHWSSAKETLIPLPPPTVQTEIVKILDALTALTSELTSELILRRKQYEYYREKLLSEEELGKVGFEWKTLGDVAKIQRGASPRPISQYITDEPNGIPWIKIGDTSLDSKYIENTAQKITIEGAEKSRILKSGDFVMSNSMSYGRPYILKISGAIHDGWASISDFKNILNSDFLYYYLSSNTVQNYWNGKINSSSVSNLNSDIIKSLPIPIPTLNIQIEIAKTLDKFETLTNSITEGLPLAIEQSKKRYEYYRELLLNFPGRE